MTLQPDPEKLLKLLWAINGTPDKVSDAVDASDGDFDEAMDVLDARMREVLSALCDMLGNHDPVSDQCRLPEHDHCNRCGLAMPGAAPWRTKA